MTKSVATKPAAVPRIAFVYIAQAHQALHNISCAVELARRRADIEVHLVVTSSGTRSYLKAAVAALGGAPVHWRLLGPRWLESLSQDSVPPKLLALLLNAGALGGYDVLVTPERTTAALRLLSIHRPKLVYTQHGAGDRAGPFEPRLGRFDMVFAAGRKQVDRMVDAGLVRPEQCAIVGYPKFDVVDRLKPEIPRLFAHDRPTVLYNPHFDPTMSSWPRWGTELLAAFAAQDRYNLIFAPHLRLFDGRNAAQVPGLAPFLGRPQIHIDLGGPNAIDMTYTRMADVYVGDVSSQVYEFIRQPRPCLFLNAHGEAWRGDESFRHFTFGPVLDEVSGILAAVDDARRTHADYAPVQAESFRYTFETPPETASVRGAAAIASLLE